MIIIEKITSSISSFIIKLLLSRQVYSLLCNCDEKAFKKEKDEHKWEDEEEIFIVRTFNIRRRTYYLNYEKRENLFDRGEKERTQKD